MQRFKKVQNITIVGGGTAGWLTACYFARRISVHQCAINALWRYFRYYNN